MKKLAVFLFFLYVLSCGGGKVEGQMNSVIVSVNPSEPTISKELAEWRDVDNDGICDEFVPATVQTVIKVRVDSIPSSLNKNPSPVKVYNIRVSYVSLITGAPALNGVQIPVSIVINPDSETVIPITLINLNQSSDLSRALSRNTSFGYQILITVDYSEVYSGRDGSYTSYLNLELKDTSEGETCQR